MALAPRRVALVALLLFCIAAAAAPLARAEILTGQAVAHDSSPPLRTIQPKHAQSNGAHPARRFGKMLDELRLEPGDRGRQAFDAPAAPAIPGTAWEGVSNRDGVFPPDTNGDVGPRDYVQWVNLSLEVWSKTGTSRLGPVEGNTLWQGFGVAQCANDNQGDPTVTYDRQAD